MPKATFFNLPQEKREQILQFAITEFAANDYESASISRIVAQAGIAKGSFYQYFEDKADLYTYLLDLLGAKKREYFAFDHPDPQHVGIFAYLRWMAQNGVAFELTYPELTRIAYRALTAGTIPPDIYARARTMAQDYYHQLVEIGKAQGDIAAELDTHVVAYIFDTVLSNLGNYLIQHELARNVADTATGQSITAKTEIDALLTGIVNILESGMAPATNRLRSVDRKIEEV
jgi:AcrR family transcriptional regulator